MNFLQAPQEGDEEEKGVISVWSSVIYWLSGSFE